MDIENLTSVAVVGPGAIGTTIAAVLHEVGRTPLLCGRTFRDHLTLQEGDRLISIPGPVQTDPGQIDHTVDLVFLAVKTTQTEAAAGWLAALVGPQTVVCVLQNGVEQRETIAPHCPRGQSRWLGALARRCAPQPAGHAGFSRDSRSTARHPLFR